MVEQQTPTGKVFAAIENVMAEIAKEGVGKNATNTQQNFKYRALDDVMDALSPLLAKHHLLILPCVEAHELRERTLRSGAAVLHAVLKLNYTFVCPIDGSTVTVGPIYGEAMDSGDKATNKAMSAAYKYLCTQSFCIPFSGDDPDAQSHEIAGTSRAHEPSSERGAESHSETPSASRAPASPASSYTPVNPRPGGVLGFGKKHKDTPWNVVPTDYLEWALNADRIPQDLRIKIASELEWREFELAKMERIDEEIRERREAPLDEEIP